MNEHRSKDRARMALAALLTALLSVGLAAQNKKLNPKSATLAQAVVVEIYEHNLGKALGMYRAIAEDEERTEDTRTKALLRLGKVYQRLGQRGEAQASFRKAAAGSGDGAKEAAVILAGGGVDGGDLVQAKVRQALAAMRLTGKPDRSDLNWIGQPAVPYVIKAVEEEKADLRFITNAAGVLFRLGGPKVLRWIDDTKKSDDILRRRAVIKGFSAGDRKVRAKLATFMADGDVTVRREVVDNGSRILTAAQYVQALQDADERVRVQAMERIGDEWWQLDHDGREFENFVAAMPALEKETRDVPSRGSVALAYWLQGYVRDGMPSKSQFPATDAGRGAILKAARFKCFHNCNILWPPIGDTLAKNLYVDELTAASRTHDRAIVTLVTVLHDVVPTWSREAMASVLTLVQRGYDLNGLLAKWVAQHGTAEDMNAVVAQLGRFHSNSGVVHVCNWMTRVGAPDNVLSVLTRMADRDHGSGQSRPPARFFSVLKTIHSLNSKGSIDYIVGNLRKGRPYFYECITKVNDSVADKAILQRMLVVPDRDQNGQKLREYAFQRLLQYHTDPGDPQLFARAYEIGMGASGPAHDPSSNRMVVHRGLHFALVSASRTSPENRAKIVGACLSTGDVEAFKDLSRSLDHVDRGPAATVVARLLVRCPVLMAGDGRDVRGVMISRFLRSRKGGDAAIELSVAALSHDEVSIRKAALDGIPYVRAASTDPRVARALLALLRDDDSHVRSRATQHLSRSRATIHGLIPAMTARLADDDVESLQYAIRFLGRRDPERLLAKADDLLRHEDASLRYLTAMELLKAHGAKVIDKVGPVLLDERVPSSQRLDLVKPFGSLMDLKVVPFLLQALKSPELQAEAKKQLEAVRFFHEQSSKWSKLVDGSGFTETSAVEALIQQAKSDSKDVRLAAIASLGTLADPESLPFLVKLIGDRDQDIAKVAKAAVARINRADEKARK